MGPPAEITMTVAAPYNRQVDLEAHLAAETGTEESCTVLVHHSSIVMILSCFSDRDPEEYCETKKYDRTVQPSRNCEK